MLRFIALSSPPASLRCRGVATCAQDAADYDGLFALADRRLYQAKAAGRNCVVGERGAPVETPVRLVHAV